MWRQANEDNRPHAAASWAEKVQEFKQQADIIRRSIQRVDQIAGRIARDAPLGRRLVGSFDLRAPPLGRYGFSHDPKHHLARR